MQDKSRWVSELERALLDERIDVAVHSAKDVPTELDEGLELVAVPERADPRDAICGASALDALPHGARIGTSSLRRTAQIRALRDDLEVVEPARQRRHAAAQARRRARPTRSCSPLAGLQRLGRADEAGGVLDEFVPAAGQGALALEARAGIARRRAPGAPSTDLRLAGVRDRRAPPRPCPRSLLQHAGRRARRAGRSGRLRLDGWVGLPDGSAWLRDTVTGDPEGIGRECAQRMLAAGAAELLARAEAELAA